MNDNLPQHIKKLQQAMNKGKLLPFIFHTLIGSYFLSSIGRFARISGNIK